MNKPFFFESEQGEAVTVNGDRYRAMLNEFLFIKIEEEDIGTFGCVYAWTTLGSGPAIDLQKLSILAKKIIFSDEADEAESLFGADFGPEA